LAITTELANNIRRGLFASPGSPPVRPFAPDVPAVLGPRVPNAAFTGATKFA